jgi:tRNA(Ile)-lysidine synthase
MTAPEGDTEPKGARFGVADDLEARVRAGGLLPSGKPILVLLSGGRDSVCLLDLAVRIAGAGNVRALHVNYGLRDSAGDDETLCRELCERLDVPFEVRHPRRPEGNLQAWAREQRYAEAARSALARGALVATGHTASDQVETILYRLAASPGRRALLGMAARDGRLIRPLLEVTRAETRAYCEERGLAWNEDPSNESPVYARNRVRHGLVAALLDLHPAAEENVLRTLELLRDEAEVLDAAVDAALADAGDPPSVAALAALPPALTRLAVQRLADLAASGEAPSIQLRIEEILRLGAGGGTASLDLGRGLRAVVEYGRLRFVLGPSPAGDPEPVPLDAPGRALFAGGEVIAERGADLPVADGTLDADTLTTPLHVRAWRPGDRMRPLGLDGTRTLQDLFTDKKIPRAQRHAIPVVLSEGEIAWIPGVATGDRFKVTPATRDRVRLSWRQPHH